MHSLTTKEFWTNLAVKSQVTLTDFEALEASQSQGRGLQGMEYVLEEILVVAEKDDLCKWYINRIVNPDQELYLVAKVIGDEVQLTVYYVPPAVITGTRKEQVAANNLFLFQESQDWQQLMKLQHAHQISWQFTVDEQPQDVQFEQKGGMELTGKAVYKPNKFINQTLLATISEYKANADCSDPDLMILEIGYMNSSVGGVIKVLLGAPVNQFEVSILNTKKSPIVSGSHSK